MRHESLHEAIQAQPFRPFELVLVNNDRVITAVVIEEPEREPQVINVESTRRLHHGRPAAAIEAGRHRLR